MTMTIRTRMVINGILSVIFSVLLCMGIVAFLLQSHSMKEAKSWTNRAFSIVQDRIESIGVQLKRAAHGIGSQRQFGSKVDFIEKFKAGDDSNETMKEMVEQERVKLAQALGEFAQAGGIRRAAIYDAKGDLVCSVEVGERSVRLLLPKASQGRRFLSAEVPFGQRPKEDDWKEIRGDTWFSSKYPMPLSSEEGVMRRVFQETVWIEARAPLMKDSLNPENNELERVQGGLVLTWRPLDEEVVRSLSKLTGTRVLFLTGAQSLDGKVRKTFRQEEGPEAASLKKGAKTTSLSGVQYQRASSQDGDILIARYPLEVQDGKKVAVSIEYSLSESQRYLRETLLFLLLIAVVAVILTSPVTWYAAKGFGERVRRAVTQVGEAAHELSSVSLALSQASQSVSAGASEQAGSLEETSSSLEEMSSVTRQNAEHAAQANRLMESSIGEIVQANASMKDLRRSMERITEASDQTARIIKTIDEIAFQTNLLALNAAVEAARAGEAGMGFAVVADEVRNLAQRAAEAARETQQLIEGSLQHIEEGSRLVVTTDEAFDRVEESARRVAELLAEIAAASREQAQGIEQINSALTQMDHVVQQNAANAEQSAAAAEELSSQAQTLQEIVKELKALVEGVKGSRGESDKRPELAQGEERSFNSHDTEKQAAESLHGGNGRRRPTISEVKRSLPQVTGKA